MEAMLQMEGNKGVRGGQGYEGVTQLLETVFFDRFMNPLLHL